MASVKVLNGSVQVDASLLAEQFDLEPSSVIDLLRRGEITSRYERGTGEDEGRHRLTFFHGSRRLRLIVDGTGQILRRSCIDFGERALPASLHKPGP
ncbi:DUF6522 family protein [Microvirga sp. 17 mud 1-3]|uniref:DUF6522 family protein n=1 Tax=Microvirga sp. 17 mud 1-3 TaxID=2082949 RepID=UPI000D6B2964|nr:DUF6522 family protein [Microvirga sp. 17 mud 1-3]AWM86568.1 hypothetical protein C4E04_07385 [Microvirga sp. 17 mud 1-3]